jgi:hypothetical protein
MGRVAATVSVRNSGAPFTRGAVAVGTFLAMG